MSDNLAVSETERRGGRGLSQNLRARILWGSVLAAVALLLTYAGPIPFAVLVLVVALFVSWEWGRMVRGVSADVAFYVQAIAVTAAIALTTAGYAALAVAVIVTAAIIFVPLVFGRGARLSALGAFYVGLPSISLVWLRQDAPYGFLAVLLIFAVVWSSDIAAYAAGRTIGGPKLWPRDLTQQDVGRAHRRSPRVRHSGRDLRADYRRLAAAAHRCSRWASGSWPRPATSGNRP